MSPATVRVHGIKQTNAAFRKVDRKLALQFGKDLKEAASPVVEEAQHLEQQWRGASINTVRAKRSGPRVFVEQSARKKTGLRPDFGALQMRSALIPALDNKSYLVFSSVHRVLDKYAVLSGF